MRPELADTIRRVMPRPAFAIPVSIVAVVFGILTNTLFFIIAGSLYLVINVVFLVLVFRARDRKAPVAPASSEVRDAVLAELGPGWRADEAVESGHGFTNVPTVTFARGTLVGPALWFETPSIVRVRFPVPGGHEVSHELWPPADLPRLVAIVAALTRGDYTTPSSLFVAVEVAGRGIKLDVFPTAALDRVDRDDE